MLLSQRTPAVAGGARCCAQQRRPPLLCRQQQQPQRLQPARPSRSAAVACAASGGRGSAKRASKACPGGANNKAPQGTGAAAAGAAATAVAVDAAAMASVAVAPTGGATEAALLDTASPPAGFAANNILPASPRLAAAGGSATAAADCSSDEELDAPPLPPGAASPLGVGRSSQYRCLILDSRYLPVNTVSWYRAVCMALSEKVDVLDHHPGGFAYSAYQAHPLPAVLRVRTFVDVHEFAGKLSLTRKNLMARDHHRCQYCGSSKDLTLDHVVPVSRGGANTWTNLVTACMACNQRKGDKSLRQLGWALPRAPREPTPQELGVVAGISKGDLENPPIPWAPYLVTFRQMLEKAQRRAAAAEAAAAPVVAAVTAAPGCGGRRAAAAAGPSP